MLLDARGQAEVRNAWLTLVKMPMLLSRMYAGRTILCSCALSSRSCRAASTTRLARRYCVCFPYSCSSARV